MLELQVNIRNDWSKGPVGENRELVGSQNMNQIISLSINQQLYSKESWLALMKQHFSRTVDF
jgi:hypothetical protein